MPEEIIQNAPDAPPPIKGEVAPDVPPPIKKEPTLQDVRTGLVKSIYPVLPDAFISKIIPTPNNQGIVHDQTQSYDQARDDAQLIQKAALNKEWHDDPIAYAPNAKIPDAIKMSDQEHERVGYLGTKEEMQRLFLSDPSFLDKEKREEYYKKLPSVYSNEAIQELRKEGEQAALGQHIYNIHKEQAAKDPSVKNLAQVADDKLYSGDMTAAAHSYDYITQQYPDSPQGYYGKALVSMKTGQSPDIINKYISQGLAVAPNDPNLLILQSRVQNDNGNHQGAIDDVNKAIKNSTYGTKEYTNALYTRAFLQKKYDPNASRDDQQKALQSYEEYNKNFDLAVQGLTEGIDVTKKPVEKTVVKKEKNLLTGKEEIVEEKEGVQTPEQAKEQAGQEKTEATQKTIKGAEDIKAQEDAFEAKFGDYGKHLLNILQNPELRQHEIDRLNSLDGGLFTQVNRVADYGMDLINGIGQGLGQVAHGAIDSYVQGTTGNINPMRTLNNTLEILSGAGKVVGSAFGFTPVGAGFNVALDVASQNESLRKGIAAVTTPAHFFGKPTSTTGKLGADVVDNAVMVGEMILLHTAAKPIINSAAFKPLEVRSREYEGEITPENLPDYLAKEKEGEIQGKLDFPDEKAYNDWVSQRETIVKYQGTMNEINVTLREPEQKPLGITEQGQPIDQAKPEEIMKSPTNFDVQKFVGLQNAAQSLGIDNTSQVKLKFAIQSLRENGITNSGQLQVIEKKLVGGQPLSMQELNNLNDALKKMTSNPQAVEEFKSYLNGTQGKLQVDNFNRLLDQAVETTKVKTTEGQARVSPLVAANEKLKANNEGGKNDKKIAANEKKIEEFNKRQTVKSETVPIITESTSPSENGVTPFDINNPNPKAEEESRKAGQKVIVSQEERRADLKKRLFSEPPKNLQESIMRYFIAGGRIKTENLIRNLGYHGEDLGQYIWAHAKDKYRIRDEKTGEYIEKKAVATDRGNEFLEPQSEASQTEEQGDFYGKDQQDVEREIYDVLQSYPTKNSMLDYLLQQEEKGERQEEFELGSKTIIKRQEPFAYDKGTEHILPFGYDADGKVVNQKATFIYAPRTILQEQSVNGVRNEYNFLTEPENRSMRQYNDPIDPTELDPKQITLGNSPYWGAPTVNSLGEVIQGNNRGTMLKGYNLREDPNKYYDHLKSIADQTGISPETIEKGKGTHILMRLADVDDNTAVKLSAMTSEHLTNPAPIDAAVGQLKEALQSADVRNRFQDIITGSKSLPDALNNNGKEIVDMLINAKAIPDYKKFDYLAPDGQTLRANVIPKLTDMFRGLVLDGAHPEIYKDFEALSDLQKKTFDNSIMSLVSMGDDAPLESIQNGIIISAEKNRMKLLNKPFELPSIDDHSTAMSEFFSGLSSADDLNNLMNNYKVVLKQDPDGNFPSLSKTEALNSLLGSNEIESGIHKANNYYEAYNPKFRPEDEDYYRKRLNPQGEVGNNQTEPSGATNEPPAGASPASSKISEIVNQHLTGLIPDFTDNKPFEQNSGLHANGVTFGWMRELAKVGQSPLWFDPMRVGKFVDKIDRIKVNSLTSLKGRIGQLYEDLNKTMPESFLPENSESLFHFMDEKLKNPNPDLSKLNPPQKALYDVVNQIKGKILDMKNKAMAVGAISKDVSDLIDDTANNYLHRELWDKSDLTKKMDKRKAQIEFKANYLAGKNSWVKNKAYENLVNSMGQITKEMQKGVNRALGKGAKNETDLLKHRELWQGKDQNGVSYVVQFDESENKIIKWKDGKPETIGSFNGNKNGRFSDLKGSFLDNKNNLHTFEDATVRDIESNTGKKYIKDPFRSVTYTLQKMQELYNYNVLYSSIKNSELFKPYTKFLDEKTDERLKELQKGYTKGSFSPQNIAIKSELEKLGLSKDFLDTHQQLPPGTFSAPHFDKVWMDNHIIDSFSNALNFMPPDMSMATKWWGNVIVLPRLIGGAQHIENIAELGAENMFNLTAVKNMVSEGGNKPLMSIRALNNQSELFHQIQERGVNFFSQHNIAYDKFTQGLVDNEIQNNKEFQGYIADLMVEAKKNGSFTREALTNTKAGLDWLGKKAGDLLVKSENVQAWIPQDINTLSTIIREFERNLNDIGRKLPSDEKGLDWKDIENHTALNKAVASSLPKLVQYNIPTQFAPNMLGRFAARALRDKKSVIFAGYDYGRLQVLANDVKALFSGDIRTQGDAVSRWAARGAFLYARQQFETHLNQDDKKKSYLNVKPHGTLTPLYDMWKTLQGDETKMQLAQNLLHISPLMTMPVELVFNHDLFTTKQIYDRNGSTIDNVKDAVSYVMGGGNIVKLADHMGTKDYEDAGKDIKKMIGLATPSQFSPADLGRYINTKNFYDDYEGKLHDLKQAYESAATDERQKSAIKEYVDAMRAEGNSLVDGDIKYTKRKLEELSQGVTSPLDKDKEKRIKELTNHLDELDKLRATNNKILSQYTKAIAEGGGDWLKGLGDAIKNSIYH